MDANLKEIINNLDEKAPRSRLGPYRDLIRELRRLNRTYREILQILSDRCQIRVSISTLHDFMRIQRRIDSQLKKRRSKEQISLALDEKPQRPVCLNEDISALEDVQQRIATLKQRTTPTKTAAPRFSYDPSQPLHLPPKKSGSHE
jgi:hypothetical protein